MSDLPRFAVAKVALHFSYRAQRPLHKDLGEFFQKIVPEGPAYHHHDTWGDDNGSSHVRAALLKPSLAIPFAGGQLLLGTWQQVVVIDFDTRARQRTVVFQIIGE